MILLDICICIITFLIGFGIKQFFNDFTKWDKRVLNWLFIYHFAIAIGFNYYLTVNGGDAVIYWEETKISSLEQIFEIIRSGSVTGYMLLINYVPANLLDLSFFTGNMIYALIGYTGFVYLYRIFKEIFVEIKYLRQIKILGISVFPLILFLPNFHFWCAGIAKDTLLFFAIMICMYAMFDVRKRLKLIIIALIISLLIRPHITFYLFIGLVLGYLLDARIKSYKKIAIIVVAAIGITYMIEYVLQFIQLENLELATIEEYTNRKSDKLSRKSVGSALDVESYSYLYRVFTFLYRPLFFDINGLLTIVSSIENFILLVLTIITATQKPLTGFIKSNFVIKSMFIYFLLGALTFPLILGNLGIMLRQKNMFMPLLTVFCLWVIFSAYKRKNKFVS